MTGRPIDNCPHCHGEGGRREELCPIHGVAASLAAIDRRERERQTTKVEPEAILGDPPSQPLPPARDRLLRRARSIFRHHNDPTNPRQSCCRNPDPQSLHNAAVFRTRCLNCGTVV